MLRHILEHRHPIKGGGTVYVHKAHHFPLAYSHILFFAVLFFKVLVAFSRKAVPCSAEKHGKGVVTVVLTLLFIRVLTIGILIVLIVRVLTVGVLAVLIIRILAVGILAVLIIGILSVRVLAVGILIVLIVGVLAVRGLIVLIIGILAVRALGLSPLILALVLSLSLERDCRSGTYGSFLRRLPHKVLAVLILKAAAAVFLPTFSVHGSAAFGAVYRLLSLYLFSAADADFLLFVKNFFFHSFVLSAVTAGKL